MDNDERDAKVFYAYQSDRHAQYCKNFISSALENAIRTINEDKLYKYHINIDHDYAGKPGWPDIPDTILSKLRECDAVVADLTHVATTEHRQAYSSKQYPNSNVAFELGYAMAAITPSRLVLVANEEYGSVVNHFFDVHHRLHPIRYNYGPSMTNHKKINAEKDKLTNSIVDAIRLVLDSNGRNKPTGLHDLYSEWWNKQNNSRVSTEVRFGGHNFWVDKRVFSPDSKLTNSASIMARSMPNNLDGCKVLDLGTGCGVHAILAALRGAEYVLAVDKDKAAVKNAEQNVEKFKLNNKVIVKEGDLFEKIDDTFDLITANLPIDPRRWKHVTNDVDSLVIRFLQGLKLKLKPGGTALLAWASFGDVEVVKKEISNQQLRFRCNQEETFGVTWYIFEILN